MKFQQKYFYIFTIQQIKASDISLSANIRHLRETGVESMVKSIHKLGFVFTSQLTVSGPHEGDKRYHLIDGAHRWAAVERLSKSTDEETRNKYKDYIFNCHALPSLKRKQEMSLAFGLFIY